MAISCYQDGAAHTHHSDTDLSKGACWSSASGQKLSDFGHMVMKCGFCKSLSQQASSTSFLAANAHLQNPASNSGSGETLGAMILRHAAA